MIWQGQSVVSFVGIRFGSFDVDDLKLNTLGGKIGYLPIKLLHNLINYEKKATKVMLGWRFYLEWRRFFTNSQNKVRPIYSVIRR